MIEPFRDRRRRRGARRPAPAPRAHAASRRDRRHRLGVRHPDRLPARARRVLAGRVRLARRRRRGSTCSRSSSPRSTGSRSTSCTPLAAPRRAAAAPHARLAGFDRRVPRRDPALTDPDAHGGTATRSTCRAVVAGLRVLGADATRGWDTSRIARGVRRADGAGSATSATARRAATGARRSRRGSARSIPEHCAASTSTCRSPTARRRRSPLTEEEQGRPRRDGAASSARSGLRERAGDQAADPRRRAQRLAGRSARVDRREVPRAGATATATSRRLHTRPAAHQRDDLLGHADDHVVGALYWETGTSGVCTSHRRSTSAFPPASRAYPRRDPALPALVGGAAVQRDALGRACPAAATSRRWSNPTCSSPTSATFFRTVR